ncbi:multiheme c-type cytochrome, partial [Candidatus Riflebacteria bacterium]
MGSKACQECHGEEYDLWKESTHSKAGGPPDTSNVISKFDGTVLQFKDATVSFSINTKGEYLIAVALIGRPEFVLKVDAVIGRELMVGGGSQALFTKFPDGTLRFLPFDFNMEKKLWFAQLRHNMEWYPISSQMSINDCLHWPPFRILGEHENFSPETCRSCHGSQIQVMFAPEKEKYLTRYVSLGINCESCHGPGKKHIELAKSGLINDAKDIGMEALGTLNKDRSLNVCFQCHAAKASISKPGQYLPGKRHENYYTYNLNAWDNKFHPDGRILIFSYQKNHIYSDCYLSGSMTCVDCHDPHSQKYRDIWGKKLPGIFDDEQCMDCHRSKLPVIEKHTHHKKNSKGSLCISCHMPYLQHKGVGNKLRIARSDHTIPIPRPVFDESLGIENACYKCHRDIKITGLQVITDEWYGGLKPHKPIIKALINADKYGNRKLAAKKLLDESIFHPIAEIIALSKFIHKFISPDMSYLEPEIIEKLKKLCDSPDLDLQALALAALHIAGDDDENVHSFLWQRSKNLKETDASVKYRWVFILKNLAVIKYLA